MSRTLRPLVALLLLLVVVAVARPQPPPAQGLAAPAALAVPTKASSDRTLTFVDVAPANVQAVQGAIAGARPEARRLIASVAGLITVRAGPAGPGAAGTTQPVPGGYELLLDLGGVYEGLGPRGVDRLVLHELGHVVDFALVPPALNATLDAQIPQGYGCEGGRAGGCAAPGERFAETFAKWAMNDIGVSLEIGYKVPPPAVPLGTWGEPLTQLAP